MGSLLETLSISFRADTTDLDAQLRGGATRVQEFVSTVNQGGGTASEGLKQVASSAGGIKAAFAGVYGAVSGFVSGIVAKLAELNKQGVDNIKTIGRMAARFGATAAEMGTLAHVATVSGLELEDLNTVLTRFEKSVSEAASGSGDAAKSFNQLGLDAAELISLPIDQQVAKFADALNKVPNAADRIKYAMELGGRSGVVLMGTLKSITNGVQEFGKTGAAAGMGAAAGLASYRDQAERFGLLVSSATTKTYSEAGKAYRTFQQAMLGIGTSIAAATAPVVLEVNKIFASLGSTIAETITSGKGYWIAFGETVASAVRAAGEMISGLKDVVFAVFRAIGVGVSDNFVTWDSFRKGLLRVMFDLQYVFDNWKDAFSLFFRYVAEGFIKLGAEIGHFFSVVLPGLAEGKGFSELMKRELSQFEKEFYSVTLKLEHRLYSADYEKFIADKFAKFDNPTKDPASGGGKAGGEGGKGPAAYEAGSKEAFSIIASQQKDKMFGVANATLQENKKMRGLLEKILKQQGFKLAKADL